MSSSRSLRFVQIGLFVACLGVPAVWFGLGGRGESVDNRRPVPRPALHPSNLFDTEATAQFGAYFDDAFPLRDEAIQLDARVDRTLGDSPNSDVVVGRHGWLFLRESIDEPCRDDAELAALADTLERADRLVRSTGRELINVIAPDKASVFPDRLATAPTCVLRNAEALSELDTTAPTVMEWAETSAVAAADDRAYRRLDTHWTTTGATPTARAVVDLLAPGRWDDDALVRSPSGQSVGDLSVLTGLRESEPETIWRAHPGPAPATTTSMAAVDRDGLVIERIFISHSQSSWDGAIGGRTVLLHDSFGLRFADVATGYFADITSISDPSPRRNWATESIVDADRIIRLEVQRRVFPSVVGSDLAAEFAIALQDELALAVVTDDCATGCVVSGNGDLYLIATLVPGEPNASVEYGGRRFELDALTPAAAWAVSADTPLVIAGDAERVIVTAVAVP